MLQKLHSWKTSRRALPDKPLESNLLLPFWMLGDKALKLMQLWIFQNFCDKQKTFLISIFEKGQQCEISVILQGSPSSKINVL